MDGGRLLRPYQAPRERKWPHYLMGAYGLGWAIALELGVRVYAAELVAIFGLLLLQWRSILRPYPTVFNVLSAYGLWIVAIFVSDIANGTALFDSLRNMATPMIGGIGLVFVACATARAPSSLLTFLAVMALAKGVLGEPLYGDRFSEFDMSWGSVQQDTNFFKVRIEPFLTPLTLCIAILLSRRGLMRGGLWLILVAIFYFSVDARSAGLAMFLAGLAVILFTQLRRPKLSHVLISGLAALVISYGAFAAYVSNSLNGDAFGHNARQLQYVDNPYNPMSLILAGRSEWLVLPQAISERPIFGWGSWARDEDRRFSYLQVERLGSGYFGHLDHEEGEVYIPVHSVIGAAWLWSGLAGFVAMAWLFKQICSMALTLPRLRSALVPAICYLTIIMIWHFFFSPPQTVRIFFPVALGALSVLSCMALKKPATAPQFDPVVPRRRIRP